MNAVAIECDQPCVYVLSDIADRAIYVGASRDVERRVKEHQGKPWWQLVAGVEVYPQQDWELALYVERNLIHKLSPEFNVQSVDPVEQAINSLMGPFGRAIQEMAQ